MSNSNTLTTDTINITSPNQIFPTNLAMSNSLKVFGNDGEILPESQWQNVNGVIYKYKIKELDVNALPITIPDNSITLPKLNTNINDKNRIYTHDNNGVPIFYYLADLTNPDKDSDPLNKLYANQINFNAILEY